LFQWDGPISCSLCYFFQPKSGPAFLVRSRKFASTVSWVIKFGVEITLEVLDLHDSLIYGCFCFQLEVHVRDECPATEVQCEYKNLGCEEVVRTFLHIFDTNLIYHMLVQSYNNNFSSSTEVASRCVTAYVIFVVHTLRHRP